MCSAPKGFPNFNPLASVSYTASCLLPSGDHNNISAPSHRDYSHRLRVTTRPSHVMPRSGRATQVPPQPARGVHSTTKFANSSTLIIVRSLYLRSNSLSSMADLEIRPDLRNLSKICLSD
ncbi:hypothetical protein LIER_20220 [Lithospermum erythrorhizon]|uniref:Uncharacterized protein n=1 Tax=Lithospermum erythrorhizon TaxID=34254 RepID=A0AAV3QPV1_LITER